MKKINVQKMIAFLIIGLLMMDGMVSCNKEDNATPNEKDTLGWGNEPINEIITIEQVLSESLYSELSNNSIINPYTNTLEEKAIQWADSIYKVMWQISSTKTTKSFEIVDNSMMEDFIRNDNNRIYNYSEFKVENKTSNRFPIDNTYYHNDLIVIVRLFKNKTIEVYLYPKAKEGFAAGGYLFLKLGQPNNGPIFSYRNPDGSKAGNCVRYEKGMPYVFFRTNIDDLANGDPREQEDKEMKKIGEKPLKHGIFKLFPLEHGVMNIFPLILSDKQQRYYTNPIFIYSDEPGSRNNNIGLKEDRFGEPYGTINGVRVINDGSENKNSNLGKYHGMFQTFQCAELDMRFANLIFGKNSVQCDANTFHKNWTDGYHIEQTPFKIAPTEGDILELAIPADRMHVTVISKIDWEKKKVYVAQQNAAGLEPILHESDLIEGNGGYKIKAYGEYYYDYLLRPISPNSQASDIKNDSKNTSDYDYLCFTADQAGSTLRVSNYAKVNLSYSTNKNDWYDYTETITLNNVGDKIYLRGDNSDGWCKSEEYNVSIILTGKVSASGNIMSLLDPTCQLTTIPNDYCFQNLFYKCNDALISAPELPAKILKPYCYRYMFSNCSALTMAPKLPATQLANGCYESMFEDCTELKYIPDFIDAELAHVCYQSMFRNCKSLQNPPALPSKRLADACYNMMFYGCSSLKTIPELPATTLVEHCYKSMFSNCSSLSKVIIPSATTANQCYRNMFKGCSNLSYISIEFESWDEDQNITKDWLKDVSQTGTFRCPKSLNTNTKDGSHIPVDWDVQTF